MLKIEIISLAIDRKLKPESIIIRFPVFLTDLIIVLVSNGLIVFKSIKSTPILFFLIFLLQV